MEEEEEPVQTKGTEGKAPGNPEGLDVRIQSMRGGGQPLPSSERAFFEPRFGADFSSVRLHTDTVAGETARRVNARAFTIGRDIVFSSGQYNPGTTEGRSLMAHELTHTIQQRSGGAGIGNRSIQRIPPDMWNWPPQRREPAPAPTRSRRECTPPYDTAYNPSSSNCAVYQGGLAKRFLTWTYRHNATCACENTLDDPKNNCVRKCLQVKMISFLRRMNRMGAAIGTCLDPIGLLDFTCPEPYCSELHDHHVDCYSDCCCENNFISYPLFWFMCEAPYPCSFVGWSIRNLNSCDG